MKSLQYRIAGFDLMQFIPTYEKFIADGPIEGNYGFDFSFNKATNTLRVIVNLSLTQNEESVLTVQFATFVEIKDESAESIIKWNEITFAKEHLAQFASFGYGALRGVMYLKTINTPIDNVILPPLDLMDLFSTPLTISF